MKIKFSISLEITPKATETADNAPFIDQNDTLVERAERYPLGFTPSDVQVKDSHD